MLSAEYSSLEYFGKKVDQLRTIPHFWKILPIKLILARSIF